MMKKNPLKLIITIVILLAVLIGILCWLGIGPVSSGPAGRDLRAELATLHGEEYTDKQTDAGIESMEFSVKTITYFPANPNVRSFFDLDTRYECKVIYTLVSPDGAVTTRTVTYIGIDPIGQEDIAKRAYIDTATKEET